ncbi:pentapeptide repeat-containing protein [Streptomyces sp. NPDC002394]
MTERPRSGRLHQLLRRRDARRPGPGRGEAGGRPPSRISLLLLSLPGLAAVAALLFTWLQVNQTGKELRITEQGQITTRFNTAIVNLGSGSVDVRLGGIYALERIMKDSPPDQGSVVSVLSAYLRRHSPVRPGTETSETSEPSVDASAAMEVLVRRRPEYDQGLTVLLTGVDLRGWTPAHPVAARGQHVIHLREAVLTGSDLRGSDFTAADLHGARLDRADLGGAFVMFADLAEASLGEAHLQGATFHGSDLRDVEFCNGPWACADTAETDFSGADLTGASFSGADLRKASFCTDVFLQPADREDLTTENRCALLRTAALSGTDLTGLDLKDADLTEADLTEANLTGADLTDANLTNADLTKANLTHANLKNTKLTGATLTGTRGLPPSLRKG